jgi:hypothetical protein
LAQSHPFEGHLSPKVLLGFTVISDRHEIIMLPHHKTAAASEEQTGQELQIQMGAT